MQNTPKANASASNPPNTWLTTYGSLILSLLAIVFIAIAWLLHDLDQGTAIATIGAILGANGLVSATQWQAAPGLLSQLQGVIAQLTEHIQVLHAQQASSTPMLPQVVRTSTPPLTQFPGPRPNGGGSSGG